MRTIDYRGVLRMLEKGAQIVDVLPSHEYEKAHIKSAIHIPLARLLKRAPELPQPARPTIVYCRDSL